MSSDERLLDLFEVARRDLRQPLLAVSVPALLHSLVIGRLGSSEMFDDDVEVARDGAEEAWELVKQLRGEDLVLLRASTVDDSLGLEEALVIKPLVVALGDYSERVVEEGKQMLGLNDQGFPNLEVLRDVVVSLSPPSLHHPANADSRVPATVLQ